MDDTSGVHVRNKIPAELLECLWREPIQGQYSQKWTYGTIRLIGGIGGRIRVAGRVEPLLYVLGAEERGERRHHAAFRARGAGLPPADGLLPDIDMPRQLGLVPPALLALHPEHSTERP